MCLLGISMFVYLIDSQVEKVERPRWKKRLVKFFICNLCKSDL